jgi:glucose-6-phosphate dehydrogenase assembly protein OpcA
MHDTVTTSSPFVPAGSVQVLLRSVEEELARQMKACQGDGDRPVHSVRMSNLVIFCDRREQAEQVAVEVLGVAAVHPARVLLVLGEARQEAQGVIASAWIRSRTSRTDSNACSEMVTLHAAGSAVARLPFAVRALLIGDLPINLWWTSNQPPPLAGAFLFDLADNAQQIIYDSRGWVEPTKAVAATASWLQGIGQGLRGGRWRVASDLNWRRLKYWRRLLAQTLEPTASPGATTSATELLIEHGPHAVIQAWELASWLTRLLGWKVKTGKVEPGVEINWQFEAPHGLTVVRIRRLPDGPSEVRQVRLQYRLDGQQAALVFRPVDATRLEVVTEGVATMPRTLTVQPLTLAELVGRQLSDRDRDPVFNESMAVAQTLAQSLLR